MITKTTASYVATIRVFVFLAVLTVPMTLASCSERDDATPAPASHSPESPSQAVATTPAPEDIADPFEAAVAAYLRFRDALDMASAIPDADYPELAEVVADEGLEAAQAIVQRLEDEGLRNTGQYRNDFEVKDWAPEENPTQIALIICSDSSETQIVDADTGEPLEGEEYGKRHVEALVELRDGRWLVTDFVARAIGSC